MSQESLHSLGDSEVMLGARPKDKHLEAPEQLVETWERPSSRLEIMICNLTKSTQSIQQSMTEQIHNLQKQTPISTTDDNPDTTNKTAPIRRTSVGQRIIRSQTDIAARLIRSEGSTPTEEI